MKTIYYSDQRTMVTETSIKVKGKDTWVLDNGVEVYAKASNGNYLRVDGKPGQAFTEESRYQAYIAYTRINRYLDQLQKDLSKMDKLNISESKREFVIKAYRKLERICGRS